MEPQIPMCLTSSDIHPRIQNWGGSLSCLLHRLCSMDSSNSPLHHRLTSLWPACHQILLIPLHVYMYINIFRGLMSFYGATDTPVLDFWWCILWFSNPEWSDLFALGGGVPQDSQFPLPFRPWSQHGRDCLHSPGFCRGSYDPVLLGLVCHSLPLLHKWGKSKQEPLHGDEQDEQQWGEETREKEGDYGTE